MVVTQQERYGRITRGVDNLCSVVSKHCTQYFAMSKQINEKCQLEIYQKCSFAITNTFTQVTQHS